MQIKLNSEKREQAWGARWNTKENESQTAKLEIILNCVVVRWNVTKKEHGRNWGDSIIQANIEGIQANSTMQAFVAS